jgi:hypothetical protein
MNDNKKLIQTYQKLKTAKEKRLFALKLMKNTRYEKLLEYEKLSESTVDILFKKHTKQKIIFKENYFSTKKR